MVRFSHQSIRPVGCQKARSAIRCIKMVRFSHQSIRPVGCQKARSAIRCIKTPGPGA